MGEILSMTSNAIMLGATAAAAVPTGGAAGGAIGAAGAAGGGAGGAAGLASSLPRGATAGVPLGAVSAQEKNYTAQQMAGMFGEMRGSAHLQLH
jgi:hypothetical protein